MPILYASLFLLVTVLVATFTTNLYMTLLYSYSIEQCGENTYNLQKYTSSFLQMLHFWCYPEPDNTMV